MPKSPITIWPPETPGPFGPIWEWEQYLDRIEQLEFDFAGVTPKSHLVREARLTIGWLLAWEAAAPRGILMDERLALHHVVAAHWDHGITDPRQLAEAALRTMGKPL